MFGLYCLAMLFTAKALVSIDRNAWGDLLIEALIAIGFWAGTWIVFDAMRKQGLASRRRSFWVNRLSAEKRGEASGEGKPSSKP